MAPGVHSTPRGESAGETDVAAPAGVPANAPLDAPAEAPADFPAVPADVSAVASLNEPTRLRIYDYVRARAEPVSRDDVADALGVPRQTAAFHLDRLAEGGLLVISFGRRSGRSGPGAGRPAKLYQRSTRQVSVSLPPRGYDLAGSLLAGAFVEAEQSGEAPRDVLERRARALGRTLVGELSGQDPTSALMSLLENHGYEPQIEGAGIALHNCPFHALAQEHAELTCGMNLHLLEGVLEGLGNPGLQAFLDPQSSRCCVRMRP